MGTLNQPLQASVGYERPVQQPSIMSGVAGLSSLFAPQAPAKPSAAQVEGAALKPYAERLDKINRSNLSEAEKLKAGRKLTRQFVTELPQYSDEAWGLAEGYGITQREPIVSPEEVKLNSVIDWAQNDPEGQNAMVTAAVMKEDGTIDGDATLLNLEAAYNQNVADKAETAAKKREMDSVKHNEELWKTKSSSRISNLIPKWTKKSSDTMTSLTNLVLSGDPSVDTVPEQMQYLRAKRAEFYNSFMAEAQAEGLHASSYVGEGEKNLVAALKPFDTVIEMFEGGAKDAETRLSTMRNAAQADSLELMIEVFGPVAAWPEFQKQAFAAGANLYGEDATTFYKGLKDMGAVTGPRIFDSSVEDIDEAMRVLSNNGQVDKKDIVKMVTDVLNNLEAEDQASASPVSELGYKMLQATGNRLGLSVLDQVFNAPAVENVKKIISKGDSYSEPVKDQLLSFTASQVRMNADYLNDMIASTHPEISYTTTVDNNGVMFLMRDGRRLTEGSNGPEKKMLSAVRSINKINKSVSNILGLDKVDNPSSVLPLEPMSNQQEIEDYLNSLSGAAGDDTVQGATGGDNTQGSAGDDTLGEGNGPIAQSLGIDFAGYEEANGLPSGYLERVAYIESKGNPKAQNPNSSAGGLFQQIDSNAKAYGVADRFDATQSTEGAVKFAVDNIKILEKALGRKPQGWELYLAHQQGGAGAAKLLSNPSAKAADIVGKDAVRLNGGHENMTAGEFAKIWATKYSGGRGPVNYSQATGKPNENVRPNLRPESLGDFSEAAKAVDTMSSQQAPATPQKTAEATQVSDVREGTQEKLKGAKKTADEVTDILSLKTKEVLDNLGVDPKDVPVYENGEEVSKAFRDGKLTTGDVIIVGGQLIQL